MTREATSASLVTETWRVFNAMTRWTGLQVLLLCIAGASISNAVTADRWAVAVFPSGTNFSLEVAADDATRTRGYMYRDRVGPKEGMLFLFPEDGHHSFWMKNCKVSLDIIWMDENYRVVEIAHDAKPCPADGPCPSVLPSRAARLVLEVAGGTAAREELQPGDQLVILAEPPLP